jgi:hypothetical protein
MRDVTVHGKEDTRKALMKDGNRDTYRGNGLRRLAHWFE